MTFRLLDRRRFFTWTGALGTLGARFGRPLLAAPQPSNVYTRLGLRPIINASGTYTHLGGSLMPAEVLDAMDEAARQLCVVKSRSLAFSTTCASGPECKPIG